MTRVIPASLQATFETAAFALATLVKIEKRDGEIITLTTWDKPLDVDIDGEGYGIYTYTPQDIEGVTTFSASINAAIDDAELTVPIDAVFVADDIRRQFYAGGKVKIAYVDPDDLDNPLFHRYYEIGQIKREGARIKFELLGPEKRLENNVGVPLTINCRYQFGDPNCGMNIDVQAWQATNSYAIGDEVRPSDYSAQEWFFALEAGTGGVGTSGGSEPDWSLATSGTLVDNDIVWQAFPARKVFGTVTAVTDARNFGANGIDIAPDYFVNGYIEWLYGRNSGERQRIKTDTGTGSIIQHRPCLDVPQIGDTFFAIVGCRKRLTEDCVQKHDNAARSISRTLRFGGFPFLAPEQSGVSAPKENNKRDRNGPR